MGTLSSASVVQPNNQNVNIDLNDVTLSEAIHVLAKMDNLNVIVSMSVNSKVTLHLHHVAAKKVLNVLLTAHDLLKVPLGGSWYIVPRQEWLLHQQDQLKLQETLDAVAP